MRIVATRRQFTWALAGGLAGCATGRLAAPAPAPEPAPAAAPPPPAPKPEPASDGSPPAPPESPLVAPLVALLQALHGERLSADELAKLRKPIAQLAEASAKLRAFPVPNGAEPHGGWIGNPSGAA